MKQILLLAASLAMPLLGNAQEVVSTSTYTDDLVVTINGQSTDPMEALVIVEHLDNGNINFALNNFYLAQDGEQMPVGNIFLPDISVTDEGSYQSFSFNGITNIADGEDEDVEIWVGPLLGDVPLVMTGKMSDDKLYVSIDIDLQETLQQIVYVAFGSDFDDDTETAIAGVEANAAQSNAIYDLSGRQVTSEGKPGIYIVGGKKVLVK